MIAPSAPLAGSSLHSTLKPRRRMRPLVLACSPMLTNQDDLCSTTRLGHGVLCTMHSVPARCQRLSVIVLLLMLLVTTTVSGRSGYSPVVIDLSSTVDVFRDAHPTESSVDDNESVLGSLPTTDKNYFRYLSVDPNDSSRIYVGAVNHVYRLHASNITKPHLKSPDLSRLPGVDEAMRNNYLTCLSRGKDPRFSCQNHVRAVLRMNERLFVCSSGSESPTVYYLNSDSLEVELFELKGGRAKCPYDPGSNYTILYVENGNPGDIPSIYSGTVTDFTNSDPVIYRPSLHRQQPESTDSAAESSQANIRASLSNDGYRLLRTEQDSRWLNDPQFVGSFDIDNYVYFFFREHALEHAGCSRLVYSRVARVCKQDEGGSSLLMDYRWTTYLKARLNCSMNAAGSESPHYFNEIYDIRYIASQETFYGLFRTIHNGFWGSAVCAFTLSSIDAVFDYGSFKAHQTFESGWQQVPENEVPVPRPGQCLHRSQELATSSLAFIKSHPLMHETVDSLHGRPLYYTKEDIAASKLAVTHTGRHTVFYIATSRGSIYKIAQWKDLAGRIHFLTVAILMPFNHVITPIWQMILHPTHNRKSYLYLATDDAVVQVGLDDCSLRYSTCTSCIRDPHCGWHPGQSTCQQHRHNAGLIQKVSSSSSAEDACRRHCYHLHSYNKHRVFRTEVLSASPFHINCSLPTECAAALGSVNDRVKWRFTPAAADAPAAARISVVRPETIARTLDLDIASSSELIMTRDNGLIIMSARDEHSGLFTCSLSGRIIARHHVVVLPCSMRVGQEDGWKKEFARWCSAFNAYTQEYNKWLCLKKRCIEEKCIPQSIIDKCLS